jgi:peptidoglycan/xylan/chitin deacetylase (PgdA/CDA1 family)
MYHQVTPHPLPAFRKYAVTPEAFAAHMRWLARARYVPIDLDTLLDYRKGKCTLPPRPAIITFDDGFQDCVDYAVPVLQARGFTAVFYLVASLVGQTSRWLMRERGIELPLMDWEAARELERAGFHCGSHTVSHPRLAELSPATCRAELAESRRLLEDNLGHAVQDMAYPHGSMNEHVRALVAEGGYRSACSSRLGLSAPDDDLLALHRIPVNGQDTLLDFACRLRTAHSFHEWLTSKASGVRRRLRRKSKDSTQ